LGSNRIGTGEDSKAAKSSSEMLAFALRSAISFVWVLVPTVNSCGWGRPTGSPSACGFERA
jgi:hypothetical protein